MSGTTGKAFVTTKSNHVAPGSNPAISMAPPLTPPPTPTPFIYTARSATAKGVCQKAKTGSPKAPTLKKSSYMDVDTPGNALAQTPGTGDVVSTAVDNMRGGKAHPMDPLSGSAKGISGEDEALCLDGDIVKLNLMTQSDELCQSMGPFMPLTEFNMKMSAGTIMADIIIITAAEPVAVATGDVVDELIDIELPGMVPLVFARHYSTARREERTPFGVGGWTHAFHQYVEETAKGWSVRMPDGRDALFGAVEPKNERFLRSLRSTLRRGAQRTFELQDHMRDLVREFAPLAPSGRSMLVAVRDLRQNRIELRYEGERLAKIVDTAKRELRLAYDARGRVSRIEVFARGAVRATLAYTYADTGELASAIDVHGVSERYTYDARHRMIEKVRKDGRAFYYRYDEASGRCTKAWGDGGLHGFEFDYDDKARTTTAKSNPSPRIYTRDARGAIVREATPDGSFVVARTFDEDGFLLEEKNAAGDTTTHEVDARGHRTKTILPSGAETTWEYEGDRLVKWTTPDGRVAKLTWDDYGSLVEVDQPLERVSMSYDARGRVVLKAHGPNRIARIAWDDEHNVSTIVDEHGGTHTFVCDALGWLVERTDPLGRTSRFVHEVDGRRLEHALADGSVVRMRYGASGLPVERTDASGRTSTYAWSATGALLRSTDASGASWETTYDVNENPRVKKNPNGELWELRYDRAQRPVEARTFDGRVLGYRWGKNDRISRIDYPDGGWREYTFDADGRIVGVVTPHGERTFERDEAGNVVRATHAERTGDVVVENELDAFGRIVAQTTAGHATRFEYGDHGRSARVAPNGERTSYRWDPSWQPAAIEHEGRRLEIQRDVIGREVWRSFAGVDVLTRWDARDRPSEQWVMGKAEDPKARPILVKRAWEHTRDNTVQTLLDDRSGDVRYRFDRRGHLESARGPGFAKIYEHDASGRLGLVADESASTPAPWSFAPGNRVLRTPFAEHAYDARGRRVQTKRLVDFKPTGEVTTFFWDAFDQLREVELPSGDRVVFTYDAFGRRVRKEVIPVLVAGEPQRPSRVVEYWWDFDTLAGERDSERGDRVFVCLPGVFYPALQSERGEVLAYVLDQVGAPMDLVDERGRLAWSAAHEPFGKLVNERVDASRATPVRPPFRMLGHYLDQETGLTYVRHRYFDPEIGRFLSPDPLNLEGGIDVFGFNGDPTNAVDPLGLAPCAGYGYIKFHYDNGRPAGVSAIVTRDMLHMGSDAAGSIHPDGQSSTYPDRGHLLANVLGGPGQQNDYGQSNLVSLSHPANCPGMTNQEMAVRDAVQNGQGPVSYEVRAVYPPGSTTGVPPDYVTQQATTASGSPVFTGPGGNPVVQTNNP